ncbi:hypothetical protein CFC21_025515, partial [Triticum aestivum]
LLAARRHGRRQIRHVEHVQSRG